MNGYAADEPPVRQTVGPAARGNVVFVVAISCFKLAAGRIVDSTPRGLCSVARSGIWPMIDDSRKTSVCGVPLARRLIGLAAGISALLHVAGLALAGEPAIRGVAGADGRPGAFEAVNLPAATLSRLAGLPADDEKFVRLLSVRVADESRRADQPAMLGRYSLEANALRFTPRYPFRPGLKYRVTLVPLALEANAESDAGKQDARVDFEVTIPESPGGMPTEVAQVYPTAAVLPENQLRFYLRFTAPMSRGEAYAHVKLLQADGRPVDLPFLEIGEELWDASGRRLTLLIDPGRIKRGVKPLEDLGPALKAGQTLTLVIDAGWKDAAGHPLKKEFRKTFKVAAPLRKGIDLAEWKFTPPRSGTREPLVIEFARSLDQGLLEHALQVADPDRGWLDGRITIANEERRFEFRPGKPWTSGVHQVVVDTALEDTAGNRIGVPFEVDVTGTISKRTVPESVRIPFVVSDRAE